ncbi:uncharacterized protein LOC132612955 [Lycium barbarum]|uniref:uncharacterized protein LOC132612955 n=1 Tax=Lycium barbarum TaxID=112863 RepID=UPI00293E751F|nr:uncharacterized protein LOC132612955 [Lycium barbarum]
MGKIVSSHSTSIKQLESQHSQISATLNQRKKGTLPNDTVANPRNDGEHACKTITTRSSKVLGEDKLVKEYKVVEDETPIVEPMVVEENCVPLNKRASIEKPIVIEKVPTNAKISKVLLSIPKPPPPFPQRLTKKVDDGKFIKFVKKLKQLSINILLLEALEHMSRYAKFMKNLVTKRWQDSFETVDVTHHCSSITKVLVQKKEDPGAFTIPCTIGVSKFAKALCDIGASINLIPLVIFNKLGLGTPQPTTMRLLKADRTIKRLVGILFNVLIRVDRFIFSVDFVILDCEVDFEVSIILERPFLDTRWDLVDVERGDLKIRMNDEEVTFHICKSMKQPGVLSVVSVIDTINEAMETTVAYEYVGEVVAEILIKF